jgi:hypothetical protein
MEKLKGIWVKGWRSLTEYGLKDEEAKQNTG